MTTLEHLQRYLSFHSELATTVEACDEVYSFTIAAIDPVHAGESELIYHFDLPDNHNWSVSLSAVGPEVLRAAISRWFRDDEPDSVDQLMKSIHALLGDNHSVRKVDIAPHHSRDLVPMYEVQWEDFLLQGQKETCLLHFGVSD